MPRTWTRRPRPRKPRRRRKFHPALFGERVTFDYTFEYEHRLVSSGVTNLEPGSFTLAGAAAESLGAVGITNLDAGALVLAGADAQSIVQTAATKSQRLQRLEVWSDSRVADGAQLIAAFHPDHVFTSMDTVNLAGKERYVATVDAKVDAWDQVVEGVVVAPVLDDNSFVERRVVTWEVERDRDGGAVGTILAEGLRFDLFRRSGPLEKVEVGRSDFDFGVGRILPEGVVDLVVASPGTPDHILKGNVETTQRMALNVDGLTPYAALKDTEERTATEFDLRFAGTSYRIDLVSERGSGQPKAFVGHLANVISMTQQSSVREGVANKIWPWGAGKPPLRKTMASHSWEVDAVTDPNLLTVTENLAAWGGTATVAADAAVAPDGTTTADNVTDDDGAAFESLNRSATVADDSATYTASIYVRKKSSGDNTVVVRLGFRGGTTELNYDVQWDPVGGNNDTTINPPDAFQVEDVGDDWVRIQVTGANNSTGNTTARLILFPDMGSTLGSYDATAIGNADFWGAQLEQAATAGPYVTDPNGGLLTLSDPFGIVADVFRFDDQFQVTDTIHAEQTDGTLTRVTGVDAAADTVAVRDTTGFSATDRVTFRRDSAGNDLTWLENPANQATGGEWTKLLDLPDIIAVENLASNPHLDQYTAGAPDDVVALGGAVLSETDVGDHVRRGTSSLKVTCTADGDGAESTAIAVSPTTDRKRLVAQFHVRVESGGLVKLQMVDATNNVEYPTDDEPAAELEVEEGRAFRRVTIRPAADFTALNTGSVKLKATQLGDTPVTFYIDSWQLLNNKGLIPEDFVAGNGANLLWDEAGRALASDVGVPVVSLDTVVVDAHRVDTSRSGKLVLGGTVHAKDDDLSVDADYRITEMRVDHKTPALTKITLADRRALLSKRLAKRERAPVADLVPPESGADVTAGQPFGVLIDRLPERLEAGALPPEVLLRDSVSARTIMRGYVTGYVQDGEAITFPANFEAPPAIVLGSGGLDLDTSSGSSPTKYGYLVARDVSAAGFTCQAEHRSKPAATQGAIGDFFRSAGFPAGNALTATGEVTEVSVPEVSHDDSYIINFDVSVTMDVPDRGSKSGGVRVAIDSSPDGVVWTERRRMDFLHTVDAAGTATRTWDDVRQRVFVSGLDGSSKFRLRVTGTEGDVQSFQVHGWERHAYMQTDTAASCGAIQACAPSVGADTATATALDGGTAGSAVLIKSGAGGIHTLHIQLDPGTVTLPAGEWWVPIKADRADSQAYNFTSVSICRLDAGCSSVQQIAQDTAVSTIVSSNTDVHWFKLDGASATLAATDRIYIVVEIDYATGIEGITWTRDQEIVIPQVDPRPGLTMFRFDGLSAGATSMTPNFDDWILYHAMGVA